MMTLVIGLLNACWRSLLFLIDWLDGGDDDDYDYADQFTVHYNYRTGEIDPVKRFDGLYDNPL